MRILYVNNINQVAEDYGRALMRRHHAVTVYEPTMIGGFAPPLIKLALMPRRIFDLRHIVGKLSPRYFDVVHIHWASYGLLGLLGRTPFIIHCHGSDVRSRLAQPFFRLGLAPIFQRAAAVCCITPDLLPIVRLLRSDAIFLPAPIDTTRFAPLEAPPPPPKHPWTILLFARLDPDKGVDVAIEGIAQFVQRHRAVHVRFLDWGLLKEGYKRKYGASFECVARVAPEDVPQLLRSADVVVGQLTIGALGLSELQAMSCAKPVIASFKYGNAYPTPPPMCQATTADEVDKHLENLYQHAEMGRELGYKARAWIMHNHGEQLLVAQLEHLYQAVIKEG